MPVGNEIWRVFAENRQSFHEFVNLFKLHLNDCRYITNPDQIRGLNINSKLFYVGDVEDKKFYHEIDRIAMIRGYKKIKVQVYD